MVGLLPAKSLLSASLFTIADGVGDTVVTAKRKKLTSFVIYSVLSAW